APGGPEEPAHDSGVASIRKAGDTVVEKTGRDWDQWFELLDRWDASTRPHPEIASWLSAEHGVAGWWAQSITVAYEQARGIRAPGQGRDGTYTVSASKTIDVPLEDLFRAVEDPAIRDRWLDPGRFQVTGVTAGKSVRGRSEGDTRVTIGFTVKGASKTLIALAHSKIADPQTAKELKEFWAGRLKELKQLLER
ncbi:MAG TPA: DUF4287 domain-containing protein, partial [Actinomycetota bacterium]|nr:DUF4287 domain-containing protein [Actinomycetota bacterium]